MVNILQPIPKTCPSFLYSIAGAATELANPVIGTNEPAPANLPILLNRFNPVKKALMPINIMDTIVFDKTGTLTNGVFEVTEVIPANIVGMENTEIEGSKTTLLSLTAAVEHFSTHPIAESIVTAYKKQVKNGGLKVIS